LRAVREGEAGGGSEEQQQAFSASQHLASPCLPGAAQVENNAVCPDKRLSWQRRRSVADVTRERARVAADFPLFFRSVSHSFLCVAPAHSPARTAALCPSLPASRPACAVTRARPCLPPCAVSAPRCAPAPRVSAPCCAGAAQREPSPKPEAALPARLPAPV
jgi:hypothetical protein